MHYIRANNPSSNSSRRHRPKQHAIDWDRLRDTISREHRLITAVDPRSPRVRPSLSPVQWGVR